MAFFMNKIVLNEVYDKCGNGSKTYEEFLIKANVRCRCSSNMTLRDYFDKYDFNFLILLPTNDCHPINPKYEINIYKMVKSFENLLCEINRYYHGYCIRNAFPLSLIIASRNGMAIFSRESIIDDFKILGLEKDELNLLRRTLFEMKLM